MSLSRTDIHRGALGLEQIAACFHELASAADAIVTTQRKLSRALKAGASSKGCPEFAKNAFNASAWVLDILSESDSKYARTIEREYEVLSADLRKWFKKLAKDERDHDDFTTFRETRIRQAGEAYERRALKKDIGGEYARYVELLNTLGAEIASAQQQHIDGVNARHVITMTSSGACLARVADASWTRTCEAIRRCAPGIGRLGEARAWCESGRQDTSSEPAVSSNATEQSSTPRSLRPFPDPPYRPPSHRSNPGSPSTPPTASPVATHFPAVATPEPVAESPPSSLTDGPPRNRAVQSSAQSDLYSDYYTGTTESTPCVEDQATPQHFAEDHLTDVERDYPAPHGMAFGQQNHQPQYQGVTMSSSNTVIENHITTHRTPPRNITSREAILPPRPTPSPMSSSQPRAHIAAIRTRPVTPNNSRSSSWVGKGLRRLSMPSFTSNW